MIAIIGYGSLLWDLGRLGPRVRGDWQRGAGPRLPLEFSSVSRRKRPGALGVGIDADVGADCATAVIAAVAASVAEARRDLAEREEMEESRIGAVEPGTGLIAARVPAIGARIADWCRGEGWDGAVWADYPPNFAEVKGTPFSIPAAFDHLRGLDDAGLLHAVPYITLAPPQTDTPLRRALAADGWWRAQIGRLMP